LEKEKSGGQGNGFVYMVGDRGTIYSNSGTSVTIRGYDGGETTLPLREFPA
jgi:hypothetical protein